LNVQLKYGNIKAMESLTASHYPLTAVWDEEHVKSLLHFPRFPARLIQQEPWQSWIGKRGGLKCVIDYLQGYPFQPSHRRILDVVLSTPESVADVYADRLNISRATYFYQLRELVTAIAQALNHWDNTASDLIEEQIEFQNSLPNPLTNVVGVETTLQSILRLLMREDVRLLTLLGTGGIGKTRLSIEVAHRWEHGVCFVDLSMLNDASQVPEAISQSLGITEASASSLKKYLRKRVFLMILDNFEHLLAARKLVSDLLTACPSLKILVTSRTSLQIYGEQEIVIRPLAIADIESVKGQQLWAQAPAVALFVQRAQTVNPNFSLNNENVEAVTELCQRMEGLPLAIELAAYQTKYYSPQALLDLSVHRLDFLSQGSARMPAHQQSMRAMLDWSFDLLPADLQNFFCQLAVFKESFTIEEVKTVCEVKNIYVALTALIDQSLLEQVPCENSESRFKMLGIIREYADERQKKMIC
jgi:predicted ATPase